MKMSGNVTPALIKDQANLSSLAIALIISLSFFIFILYDHGARVFLLTFLCVSGVFDTIMSAEHFRRLKVQIIR